MSSKKRRRLGLDAPKRGTITVKLSHEERYLLGKLRQEATQKANAVSFALWDKIGQKLGWTEDELEILAAAEAEVREQMEELVVKCEKCGNTVLTPDNRHMPLDPYLFERDADGEYVKDENDERVPLIPVRGFAFSGFQHKLVVDILETKNSGNALDAAYWPLYKAFVGVEHLEDDEDDSIPNEDAGS